MEKDTKRDEFKVREGGKKREGMKERSKGGEYVKE